VRPESSESISNKGCGLALEWYRRVVNWADWDLHNPSSGGMWRGKTEFERRRPMGAGISQQQKEKEKKKRIPNHQDVKVRTEINQAPEHETRLWSGEGTTSEDIK